MGIKSLARFIIKTIFGIDGIKVFIKKQRKKINKILYTEKYNASELVNKMKSMGLKKDCVVFLHSSMTEFYNYTGTAEELIQKIIDEIGEEGTLLMPAYPKHKFDLIKKAKSSSDVVFDVQHTQSGAGYLTEVFRKWPNVKRSINIQHSVCAYGKLANYFTNEHHLSETAWDKFSPYFKLTQMNALIFSLGLDSYLRNVTLIHCLESYFRFKLDYFASFFGYDLKYNYLDLNGDIGNHTQCMPIKGGVRSKKIVKKHFKSPYFIKTKISNLNIEMIYSNYMFKKSMDLINQGISIYKYPPTSGYVLNNQFTIYKNIDIDEN